MLFKIQNRSFLLLLLAATMLAACTNDPIKGKHEVRALTLTSAEKDMVSAQNDFSLDLLRTMSAEQSGNIFVSPLSAAIVSAMIANGAVGDTRDEILSAIGMGDYDMSALNTFCLNLMENLPYQDATTTVLLKNALWVDEGYPINPTFQNDVETHYLATVDSLELSDPASANVIDAWAKKHTYGLIDKVSNPSLFCDDLHLVVANALYFKGEWHERFKQSATYDDTFHAPSGDVTVPMMHGEVEAAVSASYYYDDEKDELMEQGARVLRLYYKDKGYCMDIVLPAADKSLDECLDTLRVDWIDRMLSSCWASKAKVTMPKFSLRGQYRLNQPMQALGMQKVFGNEADLSGISTASGLFLALLQQDTFLEIDEEGTKAAAVTTGWVMDKAEAPGDPFVIDRPFALLIRDVKHGIILFAGKVVNPKG